MRLKSKGTVFSGYRRLYFGKDNIRSIEFQFCSIYNSGLGISYIKETYCLIEINLIFFMFIIII